MRGDLIRRGVFPFSSQLLSEEARHLAPLTGRLLLFLNLSLHFWLLGASTKGPAKTLCSATVF
jgi:hypothetical protein